MPAQRPQPRIRAFDCPNCGGAMTLKGMGSALSAVCPNCLSILDVADERVKLVQRAAKKASRVTPKIPLGTRGKWHGHPFEVTGFQRRTITADGAQYSWDEYVLYNPFQGFRYLTEYAGHWNDVVPVAALPEPHSALGHEAVKYDGKPYKLFQTSRPKTTFVLGEFPWRVQLNDMVVSREYVDPPYSLAAESDGNETTWSQGRYVSGKEVFQAFGVKNDPPAAQGIYSNQPNPYGSAKPLFKMMFLFSVLLLATMIFTSLLASGEKVFEGKYQFVPGAGEPSFVTPAFELKGGEKNVEIEIKTDLSNDWMFLGLALINEENGTAYDFGQEVSYYTGYDSDGSWTEGSREDSAGIGAVPGGRYYLRVEPEKDKPVAGGVFGGKPVNYTLTVKRDVAVIWPYFVVWPFLLIPPLIGISRRVGFETQRWAESDPSGGAEYSSGDDDD